MPLRKICLHKDFYIWLNIEAYRNLKIHKPSQVCLQTSSYPDNLGDIASLIQANPKLIFCFETIIILNPYNAIGKRI